MVTTKKKATSTKKVTRTTKNKKINIEKWDNYHYWSELADKKQQEILNKFAEKHGIEMLAAKFTNRSWGLYIDPQWFTTTEKTPLGEITVAVYDEFAKIRNKDGGFCWASGCSVVTNDDKLASSEKNYHIECCDTTFCEAIESICDRMAGIMNGAFYRLKESQ